MCKRDVFAGPNLQFPVDAVRTNENHLLCKRHLMSNFERGWWEATDKVVTIVQLKTFVNMLHGDKFLKQNL